MASSGVPQKMKPELRRTAMISAVDQFEPESSEEALLRGVSPLLCRVCSSDRSSFVLAGPLLNVVEGKSEGERERVMQLGASTDRGLSIPGSWLWVSCTSNPR